MLSVSTRAELGAVLTQFGLVPGEIHDIRSGRVNKHWRVVARGATYALRRYTTLRRPAAIGWEHGLLARLHTAMASWPAPGQRDAFGRL